MQNWLKDKQGIRVYSPKKTKNDEPQGVFLYYHEGEHQVTKRKFGNQLAVSAFVDDKEDGLQSWKNRIISFRKKDGSLGHRWMYDLVPLNYELIGELIKAMVEMTPKKYIPAAKLMEVLKERVQDEKPDRPIIDTTMPPQKPRFKPIQKPYISQTDIDENL